MARKVAESRFALAKLLDERMQRTYADLTQEQRLGTDASLVKTYLLEAHLPEDAEDRDVRKFLAEALRSVSVEGSSQPRVRTTGEDFFFHVEVPTSRTPIVIYVDASNPRFWVAHSTDDSVSLDRAVARIVQSPQLDRAWLFGQMLESASARGSFRGLGLDYDRRLVADVDLDQSDSPVAFLKMQLWHSKAADVLRVLRREFPAATALAKVKVKYSRDEDPSQFCLDDVKYNGKITSRGTSFNTHMALVADVYGEYSALVRRLEDEVRIRWNVRGRNRLSMDGFPVNFRLSKRIANLARFTELLFSARPPFRLWGVPEAVSDTFYRVSGVDLHVGAAVDFELTPEYIRMYFGGDACGNTVVRFFTNLQHYYDACIEANDADGQSIFGRRV